MCVSVRPHAGVSTYMWVGLPNVRNEEQRSPLVTAYYKLMGKKHLSGGYGREGSPSVSLLPSESAWNLDGTVGRESYRVAEDSGSGRIRPSETTADKWPLTPNGERPIAFRRAILQLPDYSRPC